MARGLGETTLSSSASGGGKYEEVYLRAYTIGPGARASMDCYLGLPQQLMATFIADVGNIRTGPASTQRCPKSRQRKRKKIFNNTRSKPVQADQGALFHFQSNFKNSRILTG
jgi:hypothetical protein